jgi:YVTN family beta-propeller protein
VAQYTIGPVTLFMPTGLALDPQGNLDVANFSMATVVQLDVGSGTATTLAGSQRMTGDANGVGSDASFDFPAGASLDPAGNLYVADWGNSMIRQISPRGDVTTAACLSGSACSAAGAGSLPYSGPMGVAADGAGNLYIADEGLSIIEKVVLATGTISTLAGAESLPGSQDGTGASARFWGPTGIVFDGLSNLYVADSANNTIRKVVIATGEVSTVAGSASNLGSLDGVGSAASFWGPSSLALGADGDLYVADTSNFIIRKIDLATSRVTTLAGTAGVSGSADGVGAAARFYFPQGVAADALGNLYVADTRNSTVRVIDLATAEVTTAIGVADQSGLTLGAIAQARLTSPIGLAVSSTGSLYIADSDADAVVEAHPGAAAP